MWEHQERRDNFLPWKAEGFARQSSAPGREASPSGTCYMQTQGNKPKSFCVHGMERLPVWSGVGLGGVTELDCKENRRVIVLKQV